MYWSAEHDADNYCELRRCNVKMINIIARHIIQSGKYNMHFKVYSKSIGDDVIQFQS